jgi:hypothetical protein
MPQFELEAALYSAFQQCEADSCPLSDQQKQILLQTMGKLIGSNADSTDDTALNLPNPLADLLPEERKALLDYVSQEENQNRSWKMTLLNDWIEGRDSGAVQFIRDRYGIQWLNQIQPFHLEEYDASERGEMLRLKVGDRIEVTNGLWEWVQEDGPCSREWFPCTIISLNDPSASEADPSTEDSFRNISCVVRFDTGAEYEIQGVYDWNRPNWRWLQQQS